MLKNRRFLRFCLIQAFMMAGLFSYIGSSSFVMQSEYGMSAMQFSLLFGLNGIGLIIAAMIFSRLARRFSAESLLRGGLTLAVSCAAIMLLFAWLTIAFFKRRSVVPKHYIIWLLITLLLAIKAFAFSPVSDVLALRQLLFPLLAAALLAPYFRRSQRVKRTFVNP